VLFSRYDLFVPTGGASGTTSELPQKEPGDPAWVFGGPSLVMPDLTTNPIPRFFGELNESQVQKGLREFREPGDDPGRFQLLDGAEPNLTGCTPGWGSRQSNPWPESLVAAVFSIAGEK